MSCRAPVNTSPVTEGISLLKTHQNLHNSVKFEVSCDCLFIKCIESCQPAFLDISA